MSLELGAAERKALLAYARAVIAARLGLGTEPDPPGGKAASLIEQLMKAPA